MFTRMLRPSRRHVHERVSQNEGTSGGDNNHTASNDESGGGGPSIVILGGNTNQLQQQQQQQQNDLNLLEEGAAGAADGGNEASASVAAGDDNAAAGSDNQDDSGNSSSDNLLSEEQEDDDEIEDVTLPPNSAHPFLTSQIQTERELRYRRQSTCTLLILFFLTRLWIEAIMQQDIGLIFLSMMGTTWTYRWMVTRREAEEEYDRQMRDVERSTNGELGTNSTAAIPMGDGEGGGNGGADAAVNFDPDLGLMSFQAQLALAILESQRQMFENGGYGGNDRNSAHDGPGVTTEAKQKWKSYEWGEDSEETAKLAGLTRTQSMEAIKRTGSGGSNYGSVSTVDILEDEADQEAEKESLGVSSSPTRKQLEATGGLLSFDENDEEPSCSICLCEYERGEKVTRLPCDHIYHESCLNSWTDNHVRCPLCNYDLMDGFEQPASVQHARQHAEEQRAFRNMALSTLGRRIRTRRRSTTAARRAAERRLAAAAAAAGDDSIV